MRRLLLLLSVGWLPPYVHPSAACLILGTSLLYQSPHAAEDDPTPGLRLCRCTWEPLRVARFLAMRTMKSQLLRADFV